MFKIGDFSKLTRVPVSALRYYDAMGLLKPIQVDRWTGYRYYSITQLPRLNRILALKGLGFSLDQIISLMDGDLPPARIRELFKQKQEEVAARMQEEQDRLARVEARLRQIEMEGAGGGVHLVLREEVG